MNVRKLGMSVMLSMLLLAACGEQEGAESDVESAEDVSIAFIPKQTGVGFFTAGARGPKRWGMPLASTFVMTVPVKPLSVNK
ncbi:hypothetical protein JCM19039_4099 [Geomicrobium sp. JCM 19039]|nr:hypothetical protein JCM19039_4099 [Geomicrobium sp. JCM 19039]